MGFEMSFLRGRWVVLWALSGVLLGGVSVGCKGDKAADEQGRLGQEPEADWELGEGTAGDKPWTAAELRPVFRAAGQLGVVPDFVTVDFFKGVQPDAPVDATELTRFEVVPATPGTLKFTSASRLQFEPENGFVPETAYKMTLAAVETSRGVVTPEKPWVYEFRTPEFKLLGISNVALDTKSNKKTADIVVRFSAPVQVNALPGLASWEVDGTPVKNAKYYDVGTANAIGVKLESSQLAKDRTVRLRLAAGMPYSEDISAKAGVAETTLVDAPEIKVYQAKLVEGLSGFLLEVACTDGAVAQMSRYMWDEDENYIQLSERCELKPEDAAEFIRFDPPVKFTVSAGKTGFRVQGDFVRGSYTMRIDSGARSVDGGVVKSAFEKVIDVPARKATMQFVNRGRYLPRDAWKGLAIRHMNVDEVQVTVRHIPLHNLVFWLSSQTENANARMSDIVVNEKVAVAGTGTGTLDVPTVSWINIGQMIPKPKPGVYEILVADVNAAQNVSYYAAKGAVDVARLLSTDMNLVAKRAEPEAGKTWSMDVDVWALDMKTNAPLADVSVELVRPSGHVVGSCKTTASGGCKIQGAESDVDPTAPIALLATKGDDFTYLKYDEVRINTDSEPVQGDSYQTGAAYHAAVYSDRGVYRPGERAHLVAVIRGRDERAPKAGLPVELRLKDPRQQEISRTMATTNTAGMVTLEPSFGDFAATGFYTLEVLVGGKQLESYRFNVEEFVPERLKVEVKPGRASYQSNEAVMVDVQAEYLFGGSAADSPVELRCYVEAAVFKPKFNAQMHYGWAMDAPERTTEFDLGTVTGKLNAEGKASLVCPQQNEAMRFQVPGEVVMTASVFEAGSGRTTVDVSRAGYHPEKYYIGLESATIEVLNGQPFRLSGVVVDWTGALEKDVKQVEVEVFQIDWLSNWYYDEDTGNQTYKRIRSLVSQGKQQVAVKNGRFSTELPSGAGYYYEPLLVQVRAGNALSEVMVEKMFDNSGADDPANQGTALSRGAVAHTQAPLRPVGLKISGPEEIRVGQAATVEFESPFNGRALVSAETNKVEAAEWIDVVAGKNTWTFTLQRFVPNVYVSALVVKNTQQDAGKAFVPERSFGVVSLRVLPQEYLQQVSLKVPEEIRSNSSFKVNLDVGAVVEPTFVTVAVVDEGVLQLTRFSTPEPAKKLFARKGLGVETFETIGWAIQTQDPGTTSKTGGGDEGEEGGGDGELSGRVMPVKPVALWSGVVEVPKNGKLDLEFDVPQYRGALRVMAVVVGKQRTGSAEAQVKVRDPLTIQTTLPRFLTAHDRAEVPVFVTNLSGKPRTVEVTLSAQELSVGGLTALNNESSDVVRMVGSTKRTIQLAPEQSERVVFEFYALRESGAATFTVQAKSDELESFDTLDVPFVPTGPFERRRHAVELEAGVTDLKPYLEGWVPTSERSTIWVTTMPFAGAFEHLKYLVRYPYGCLEQTTSSMRPLLYVSNIMQQVDPVAATKSADVEKMITSGIDRVFGMMLPGGGFSYWPGGTEPHYWGTAYAMHMLLDAKDAGVAVPQPKLDETLTFIEKSLNTRAESLKNEEPYLQYVLARAGRGRKARVRHLIDAMPKQAKQEQAEQEYLLKAALYLSGDRRYEKSLKNVDTSSVSVERSTGYAFYSDKRRRAFELSIFYDLFKNDPAGQPLAQVVATELEAQQNSQYYTTQELAWGITALGKWVQGSASEFGEVKLLANGRAVKPQVEGAGANVKSDRTWSLARASEYSRLELDLASKSAGKLYAYIGSEGVRSAGQAKLGGEKLQVTRSHLAADGSSIDFEHMNVGELVYAKIQVKNTSSEPVYNAILQDRFPAGWEIENPRLGRGALPNWAKKVDGDSGEPRAWEVDYMYVRDDRLEAIGTIHPGQTVELVYALRAVTAGRFTMPPVEVEAMYDARIWARAAGRLVLIRGPWAEDVD